VSAREYVRVADAADLPPGRRKVVEAHGATIAIANVDGALYAFANECSHDGAPLAEGELKDGVVTCPWHFSRFCVRSGRVVESPAEVAIAVYDVKVEGSSIVVGNRR
jgi:3-phenylpropionate/trans-cinnamate dioxygenase ferredoxin component